MENRSKFLKKLNDICLSLKWERKEQELTTEIDGYKIRCDRDRDSDSFIQIIPKGKYLGPFIESKDEPLVEEIRNKVWEYISESNEDLIWEKALSKLESTSIGVKNLVYIRITQAQDTEGRKPFKYFAEALVPKTYLVLANETEIYLSGKGREWFKKKFGKDWSGYFSLSETEYNSHQPLKQYYDELKKAEERVDFLRELAYGE